MRHPGHCHPVVRLAVSSRDDVSRSHPGAVGRAPGCHRGNHVPSAFERGPVNPRGAGPTRSTTSSAGSPPGTRRPGRAIHHGGPCSSGRAPQVPDCVPVRISRRWRCATLADPAVESARDRHRLDLERRRLEKARCTPPRGQHRLDSITRNGRSPGAGPPQIGVPPTGIALVRRPEDLLDPRPAVGVHDGPQRDSSPNSQTLAAAHSCLIVRADTPITAAVSSTVSPPKNRSSMIRAARGSNAERRSSASSSAIDVDARAVGRGPWPRPGGSSLRHRHASGSRGRAQSPRGCGASARGHGEEMGPVLPGDLAGVNQRRYASLTRAVVCRVWPVGSRSMNRCARR